jgi:hypothetical protein
VREERKNPKREDMRGWGFRVLRLIVECGRRKKKDKDLFVNGDEKCFFFVYYLGGGKGGQLKGGRCAQEEEIIGILNDKGSEWVAKRKRSR